MHRTPLACLALSISLTSTLVGATSPLSAYAGQEARAIKALSPNEVEDLLAGKGMGLARTAELNGYAGPAHVLELGAALALTPEQQAQTQDLFAAMKRKAMPLGQALVEAERKLDQLFVSQAMTPELLTKSLDEIGTLQAQVRGVHLEAHLVQMEILTPAQSRHYAQLRGYKSQGLPSSRHAH